MKTSGKTIALISGLAGVFMLLFIPVGIVTNGMAGAGETGGGTFALAGFVGILLLVLARILDKNSSK